MRVVSNVGTCTFDFRMSCTIKDSRLGRRRGGGGTSWACLSEGTGTGLTGVGGGVGKSGVSAGGCSSTMITCAAWRAM